MNEITFMQDDPRCLSWFISVKQNYTILTVYQLCNEFSLNYHNYLSILNHLITSYLNIIVISAFYTISPYHNSPWTDEVYTNLGLYSLKKTPSYWYRDSHYKPETVVRPSQVYNGIPIPIRQRRFSE